VRLPAGTPESVGGPQSAVIDAPISLVDLAPWILRIAGVEPDPRMAVRAPLAPDSLAPPARSQLFLELDTRRNRLSAARQGTLKLHTLLSGKGRGIAEGGSLLFDLATDPGELHDLSRATDRERLAQLVAGLHELAEAVHPRGTKGALDLDAMDPQTRESLIQLGYLDASGQPVNGAR
ncbi:MAG TPA: hypothetical protein VK824_05600, partial [Planctomycetota bacterium]|nr:hypothetical protein [Planctomycetota bacterium]